MPPKALNKMTGDNVQVRMYSFQRFLSLILSSEEFIYSPELVEFLSLPNDQFQARKKVSKFPLKRVRLELRSQG